MRHRNDAVTGIFLRQGFRGTVIIRRKAKECFCTALPGTFLLDPQDSSPKLVRS